MELRVWIQDDHMTGTKMLWVMEEHAHKSVYLSTSEEGIVRTEFEAGSFAGERKPMLTLPIRLAEPVFKAIVEELSNSGYRPEKESVTEGKLIATTAHLEDMRSLVSKLAKVDL